MDSLSSKLDKARKEGLTEMGILSRIQTRLSAHIERKYYFSLFITMEKIEPYYPPFMDFIIFLLEGNGPDYSGF